MAVQLDRGPDVERPCDVAEDLARRTLTKPVLTEQPFHLAIEDVDPVEPEGISSSRQENPRSSGRPSAGELEQTHFATEGRSAVRSGPAVGIRVGWSFLRVRR